MAKATKGTSMKTINGELIDTSAMAPALDPVARENQLIYLAYDAAEKMIREGTASSQIITHFLEAGSSRDKVRVELIKAQAELAKAKMDAINNAERIDALYKEAIEAMKEYTGEADV